MSHLDLCEETLKLYLGQIKKFEEKLMAIEPYHLYHRPVSKKDYIKLHESLNAVKYFFEYKLDELQEI